MQMFAAAIVNEELKVVVNTDEILVEQSYKGPKITTVDDITPAWIKECMEWHKDQKKLHRKYATIII